MNTLVIGYGNTLRGDDGVGYRVAEAIAAAALPDLGAIACHQLTPELAAEMATCDRVIFVDATLPGSQTTLIIQPLQPTPTPAHQGHYSNPATLLHWVTTLYNRQPRADHLLLPTVSMAFSESLSAVAYQGMQAAIAQIHTLHASRPS